jgi:uncharacterized membrane protein YeaQ/YmgE (transglycosylase-associated protein family)
LLVLLPRNRCEQPRRENYRIFTTQGTIMELIATIIGWAVFGLVVGAIARFLYPGRQPMGLFATMLLGIIGSLVGGFLVWAIWGSPDGPFRGAGWLASILGALIVVWAGVYFSAPRTTTRRL